MEAINKWLKCVAFLLKWEKLDEYIKVDSQQNWYIYSIFSKFVKHSLENNGIMGFLEFIKRVFKSRQLMKIFHQYLIVSSQHINCKLWVNICCNLWPFMYRISIISNIYGNSIVAISCSLFKLWNFKVYFQCFRFEIFEQKIASEPV